MRRFLLAALAASALVCPAYAQQLPPVPGVYKVTTKSVTTSATRLDAGTQREYVYVWNNDASKTLYVGFDSAVTTSTGWPVPPGQYVQLRIATPVTVYGISPSGTIDARVLEVF